ncbi:MAG: DUF1289 domain-containing protein [Gammaproteobacteria bacterium]|nr:DUF1289 domain-containing protein [Gammaproteobacteria bacterium]
MAVIKTPCLGICSTTSFGDVVCRGCKRYAFEVIDWNGYNADAKLAVLSRIERLNTQILENKLRIFSEASLKAGLDRFQIPYDESLSPYCWLQNLLKKGHGRMEKLEDYGVYALGNYAFMPLPELCEIIENDLLLLSEAHHARYFAPRKRGHKSSS